MLTVTSAATKISAANGFPLFSQSQEQRTEPDLQHRSCEWAFVLCSPLVTHPHSPAHQGATCNRWGRSSDMSLGRLHTRGHRVSLLGPGGTLHTHWHLSKKENTQHASSTSLRMNSISAAHFCPKKFKPLQPKSTWTQMNANQLVSFQEDYFVCHRLAPQITLIFNSIKNQRGYRFKIFWHIFRSKVSITSAICPSRAPPRGNCSVADLTSNWGQAAGKRITPQGSIKLIHNYSSPWQILLSEVPLMWKPASQLQCRAWFTWAQRGFRLNAGSFITLHSGGAASQEEI